jgi:hypothetical protein
VGVEVAVPGVTSASVTPGTTAPVLCAVHRSRAAPADALLGPGGSTNRPLSSYRVAVGFEPAGLAAVAANAGLQGLLAQLCLDGPSRRSPPRPGQSPAAWLVAAPVPPVPPACSALKSVIFLYSPWWSLSKFWDDCLRAACPSAAMAVTECN